MKKNDLKYTYSIDAIIDDIMKDADIVEAIGTTDRFSPKNKVDLEIDNIVKFIKNRNKDLRQKGHKVDIRQFVQNIFQRFQ